MSKTCSGYGVPFCVTASIFSCDHHHFPSSPAPNWLIFPVTVISAMPVLSAVDTLSESSQDKVFAGYRFENMLWSNVPSVAALNPLEEPDQQTAKEAPKNKRNNAAVAPKKKGCSDEEA